MAGMVLRQLQYLVALAREQHFARAAKSCNVSQPTLSAAIRQLEEELGAPIVERGHRFNGFTPEGQAVLDHAKRILAECESLTQDLGKLKHGLIGRLRLGAIPTVLPVVALITAAFRARHPLVTIAVLSCTSAEIQRGMDNFELEVGLTYLDNEPLDHVRTTPLYREEYILLAPHHGPFVDRDTVTWTEAASVPLCLLTPDMQNRRIIDGIFRSIDRQPQPTLETNSIFNLCSSVSAGHWSSIMPKALLQVFGMPEGTRALSLIEPETTRTIGMIIPDRAPPSPLAGSMFELASTLDLEGKIAHSLARKAPGTPLAKSRIGSQI
ncbi:MAG TPA: LysR family transcriptional regulator [Magnetospirillaceae bacterium]|jgi:DNA-binding transcriptional LysR family regulator